MRLKRLVLLFASLVVIGALASCGSLGQGGGEQGGKERDDTKMSREAEQEQVAPARGNESTGGGQARVAPPENKTLTLTVPKMERVQGVEVPTGLGNDEALLRENAAVRLKYTGWPWEEEANVYIAGHRLGYQGTDSYLAFYDIDKLQKGDEIIITDAEGREYVYEVYETMNNVEPTNLSVLNPVPGKNIVSLQACTLPDYSRRIIVRGELKDIRA
ncbi:MAG: class E sortase [Actinomycetota bacterium]